MVDNREIKQIIDEWDPIELLCFTPDDEYRMEIESVILLLESTRDIEGLSDGIYNIFSNSFGIEIFTKSKNECRKIAEKILSNACKDC